MEGVRQDQRGLLRREVARRSGISPTSKRDGSLAHAWVNYSPGRGPIPSLTREVWPQAGRDSLLVFFGQEQPLGVLGAAAILSAMVREQRVGTPRWRAAISDRFCLRAFG